MTGLAMPSRLPWIVWLALLQCLTGCEKAMRNMYEQPRYNPLAASALWPDGQSARPLQPGVVAHSGGAIAASSSGRLGLQAPPANGAVVFPLDERGLVRVDPNARVAAAPTSIDPTPVTIATLRRGRERFDIYCVPCHSVSGDGDGMVVRRGFPAPPTLHSEKLRSAPDSHLFDVISKGYGVMYPFADRIATQDRWAIVAYMRALQLSQHARFEDVPPSDRATLLGPGK
jgi:mono/diheme cytochrome c family protein